MQNIYSGEHKLTISDFRNLKTIKHNEIARAISTKLIKDPDNKSLTGYDGKRRPDESVLNNLSDATVSNIEEYNLIFQSLPDTKIAMEIWVSCLLSPKDSVTESLAWSINNKNSEYSAELFNEMLTELKDYFETDYELFDILKPAIEDALFKTGSYPLVILPESSIDDIINGKTVVSNEAIANSTFKKVYNDYVIPSIGYLGSPTVATETKKVGLESVLDNPTVKVSNDQLRIHPGLTITDNPTALKVQKLLNVMQKNRSKQRLRDNYGLESVANVSFNDDKPNDPNASYTSKPDDNDILKKDKEDKKRFDTKIKESIVQNLYQDRAYDGNQIVVVKNGIDASRLPISNPLVMKIPSEAVIPVHVPGNPRDVVGAFIILDEYGNPINASNSQDLYSDSTMTAKERRSQTVNIIKQMTVFKEGCCNVTGNDREVLNELAAVYASLVEEDLLNRLTNGIYGENIKIANAPEIYRIMLNRALKAMKTQVYFCPAELLTYFAFDFNKFGIGKSMLEDGKTLATLRSTMQYADIYANIQNSIGRRKFIITLDEADPEPMKTMETARTEYMRINSWNMPLMSDGPIDAINILREANIDTVVQGDNPNIPNTQIELEDVNVNRVVPNEELKNNIKNLHLSSLELPATLVDETQQSQFATQSMTAHALFNKRVASKQKVIARDLLWDHVSKYTLNSGYLIKRLSEVIKENKDLLTDKQRAEGNTLPIIEDFLDNLEINLPAPTLQKMDELQNDFDKYKNFMESAIEAAYPDEVGEYGLPQELKDETARFRKILLSSVIRKYLVENGYMSDIDNIMEQDNVKDAVKSEITAYMTPFSKFAVESALALNNVRRLTSDPKLKVLEDQDDSYGGDDYGSSDDSSSSDMGMDDDTGMDDMGDESDSLDEDMDSMDETVNEEETTEPTEETPNDDLNNI